MIVRIRPERLIVTAPLKTTTDRGRLLGAVGVVLMSTLHVEWLSLTPGQLGLRLTIPADVTPADLTTRVWNLLEPWLGGELQAKTSTEVREAG